MTAKMRVWIEIERPTDEEGVEVGKQRAALLNKVLRKLGMKYDPIACWDGDKDNERGRYIYINCPESGSFYWMGGNGFWFDLEKLAK